MVGQVDEDLQLVVESELMLLRPEVRRDSARLLAFLHEDFTEYGISGRVWDRSTITEVTVGATGKSGLARLGYVATLLCCADRAAASLNDGRARPQGSVLWDSVDTITTVNCS